MNWFYAFEEQFMSVMDEFEIFSKLSNCPLISLPFFIWPKKKIVAE